jgi:Fe-S-cluster containining protein
MLVTLHREIDSRTREIATSHGDWPCRKGCDACCRRLAELPRLIRPEWELLEEGLARLPAETQQEIAARIGALLQAKGTICPFLDRAAGSCLVYEHRPAACRTYGFYVERDRGLYCGQIEAQVDSGAMAEVVWGNAAGVEARLDEFGKKIGLLDWFSDSPEWSLRLLPTRPSKFPDPCGARPIAPTAPPSAQH